MHRLALLLLTLTVATAADAQRKPFSTRTYDFWGRTVAQADLTPDGMIVVQAESSRVRLNPVIFEAMARSYVKYADTVRVGSAFELGLEDDLFVFGFRQPWLLISSLLVTVLLLLGGTGLALRYRHRLRRLHAEQARVAEQRRLMERGREEERLRLARDLHDGPLQALYALRMQLARRTPDLSSQDVAIEQIADHLRNTTAALRAPLMTPSGLTAALHALTTAYPSVEAEFALDPVAEAHLDQQARTALFRIAQEGLSNAVRHGGATRVAVTLRESERNVVLAVQDDGTGFDVGTTLQAFGAAGHYGLVGIHERAEVLGGRVRLQSGPGGTRLEVRLPLHVEAATMPHGDGASSTVEGFSFP